MKRPVLHAQRTAATSSARSGFSLIELMIVIVIIALLAGMLFPAINGARRAANEAQIVNEIKGLEKAIADFKLKYGVEPPSRFVFYETGADWTATLTDPDEVLLRSQSIAVLRQIWPNYNPRAQDIDLNGNLVTTDTITLNGPECLVFFLGGMMATVNAGGEVLTGPAAESPAPTDTTPVKWSALGFSTNSNNPFAMGGARVGPFFEFDSNRLVNMMNTTSYMPEYLDSFPGRDQDAPYLFASSNEGRGYVPGDFGVTGFQGYVNSAGIPYNQKGFQIISPGVDGVYGVGGVYDGEKVPGERAAERDNITNFKGGRLN